LANMESLLSAENLVKEYALPHRTGSRAPVRALDKVNLVIHRGARIAIAGASGSGKSTLAACLACFERPTSGTIRFENRELTALPEAGLRAVRPQIQLVSQVPAMAFNPDFTTQKALEEPWLLHGKLKADQRRERAVGLLMRVGLPSSILERKPANLSGGQRQRLAIARALALDPKLLILDESLSALDYSVQAQIANLLLDLSGHSTPPDGPALLFITHDLAMASCVADELVVMQGGRIVESGPMHKIIEAPSHAATRDLLAHAKRLAV
jgi:peptide/nickel transport system ATP-binding protein